MCGTTTSTTCYNGDCTTTIIQNDCTNTIGDNSITEFFNFIGRNINEILVIVSIIIALIFFIIVISIKTESKELIEPKVINEFDYDPEDYKIKKEEY